MLQVLPRTFFVLVFAVAAIMLSESAIVHADNAQPAAASHSIKAWVLPVMGASITRSKIAVFIDDLAKAVGYSIEMHYSNDTDELLSVCKRQEADLFY